MIATLARRFGLFLLLGMLAGAVSGCSSSDGGGSGGSGGSPGTGGTGGTGGSGGDPGSGGDGGGGDGGSGGAGGFEPGEACESNDECPAERPICDEDDKRCRPECVTNDHCPEEAPSCVEGTCGPCTRDSACAARTDSGNYCDTESGLCVECRVDLECPNATPFCDQDEKRCLECLADDQCASMSCQEDGTCEPVPPCGPEGEEPRCDEGLVCHDTLNSCLTPCDPVHPTECADGLLCEWLGPDDDANPMGACVPHRGGGDEGATCALLSDCRADLHCINTLEGGRCVAYCEDDDDCNEADQCLPLTSGGEPVGIHVCAPREIPCEMHEDCDDGKVCRPVAPNGRLRCLSAAGPLPAGAICQNHSQCESNFCLSDGICWGPCRDDDDCGEGEGCFTLFVTYSPEDQGIVPFCMDSCALDEDCPQETACGPAYVWEDLSRSGACVFTRQGNRGSGAMCEQNSECTTGTCLGMNNPAGVPGACYGTCTGDIDCHDDSECAALGLSEASAFNQCVGPRCVSDEDCGGFREYVCMFQDEIVDGDHEITHRCEPPVGHLPGGAECSANGDCQSGICVGWGSGVRTCYAACDTAADCPSGTCQTVPLNISSGSSSRTIQVDICRP